MGYLTVYIFNPACKTILMIYSLKHWTLLFIIFKICKKIGKSLFIICFEIQILGDVAKTF